MRKVNRRILFYFATALFLRAQTLTTLASFNGTNGNDPEDVGSLVQGSDGNFYGTTLQGGANNSGTIFKMTPGGTLTTLYSFDGTIGSPSAGLVQGADGNFYGITILTTGPGSVFKITPSGTLTTLHSFKGDDGSYDPLFLGADGNFYGVTGENGQVFKISPAGTLTNLATLTTTEPQDRDSRLQSTLVEAADGNFYGTTPGGGTNNFGTVFKMTPSGVVTTLHNFALTDGIEPSGRLVQGIDGSFYGTTLDGGANGLNGLGTVFRITSTGTYTVLHNFTGSPDGGLPQPGLIQASDGNFYGTTNGGGANGAGCVFQTTPSGVVTILYSFASNLSDGDNPWSGLIQGSDGNLYGTTSVGGSGFYGTIFRLTLGSGNVPSPTISQNGGIVSGASFQAGIAPNSWITITGTNLSTVTDTWNNFILNGVLPISLDGVKVSVGGQPAYIEYVSSGQINAVAPNIGPGPTQVSVTNSNGTSSAMSATVQTVQPAFFEWGNYAVATRQDFSYAVKNGFFPGTTTVPAKPGDIIILWGTGSGPTTPVAPVGVEMPSSTTYNTASLVTVTVGTAPAIVYGAALAPGYAGLYQVAIQIPTSLANGDYPIVATIDGAQSPSTTLITVQQ
jgi:uncharacterized protein (TIGR03437 family)